MDILLLSVLVVESDRAIAQRFGQLKTELWRDSVLLPDADLFIAATTLVHGSLLVTGNSRHFARIGGLRLERWNMTAQASVFGRESKPSRRFRVGVARATTSSETILI